MDGANETFYSPYAVDAPDWAAGWPVASTFASRAIAKTGRIVGGKTLSELPDTAKAVLMEAAELPESTVGA